MTGISLTDYAALLFEQQHAADRPTLDVDRELSGSAYAIGGAADAYGDRNGQVTRTEISDFVGKVYDRNRDAELSAREVVDMLGEMESLGRTTDRHTRRYV